MQEPSDRNRTPASSRRSACLRSLALLGAAMVSACVVAAQEASAAVARIAGPRWNVNGNWAPSLEEIQRHLREAHGIDPAGMGMEDLLTLHDNDHNRSGVRSSHAHKRTAKSSPKGYAKH